MAGAVDGGVGALAALIILQFTPRVYYARALVELTPEFNPATAVPDAERDIRAGRVRFYFVGGIAPSAPGIPEKYAYLTRRYPRGVAGVSLGCSGSTDQDREYAKRYNEKALTHLVR